MDEAERLLIGLLSDSGEFSRDERESAVQALLDDGLKLVDIAKLWPKLLWPDVI